MGYMGDMGGMGDMGMAGRLLCIDFRAALDPKSFPRNPTLLSNRNPVDSRTLSIENTVVGETHRDENKKYINTQIVTHSQCCTKANKEK